MAPAVPRHRKRHTTAPDNPRECLKRPPIKENGDVPEDVQISNTTPAKLAARLCNFATRTDYPLGTHVTWLDKNVPSALKGLEAPWVDLIGFASRLGNFDFNQRLSQRRCESV